MKILKIMSVTILVVAVLVSCGPKTKTANSKKIEIMNLKPEISKALEEYAKAYQEKTGVEVVVTTCGGTCNYETNLNTEFTAGNEIDLFVVEGLGGYNKYKDRITDLSDQPWVNDTDVALKVDGKVVGFPVSVEGWGLTYNVDLITKAGIDPTTLNSFAGYEAAFKILNEKKVELGIEAPVAMAAGSGMTWVTGNHSFNAYLSNGLEYDDKTVLDDTLKGVVNETRLSEYADWVELLFTNSDQNILKVGDYDGMVASFVSGKTAFIHQGDWVDLKDAKFKSAIAPVGTTKEITDGIFVGAPSYYVVNNKSKNTDLAKAFIDSIASTPEGQDYMVNKAGLTPAFKSVTLQPKGDLKVSLNEFKNANKIYAWNQNDLPSGFAMEKIGPVFSQFADGKIDKATFIKYLGEEIQKLGK